MHSELVVRNPQASAELRIPLSVEVNTSAERVLANVLANSKRIKKWVKTEPAHDRVGIICGGGPSLSDTLDEIRAINGDVFALNGAAKLLDSHGIEPDYQIIMDAQPETASLIGPAKAHLFASQVDPVCFDKVPDAILWHTTYGHLVVDEQPGFPEHDDDYCLIGAAVSVGNTALVLLHVLGYRQIHVFGMDSSQRHGQSHAYSQPMNEGEPCTSVEFNGKKYVCSVAMELQARNFRWRAGQLKAAGAHITVHGSGLLPDMVASEVSEVEKYERMWAHKEYRETSPGESCVPQFLSMIRPRSSVIDFGCGTGRAGMRIEKAGHIVTLVDFTDNSRDAAAQDMTFTKADLTKPLYMGAQYGFCTDVLEHIPTGNVPIVIRNIMDCVDEAFFQISTVPDAMGEIIGEPLHLTVRPHGWWVSEFQRLGYFVAWSEEKSVSSSFMVTKEKSA